MLSSYARLWDAQVLEEIGRWLLPRRAFIPAVPTINTDEFVVRYKGQAPIMTWPERLQMVMALKCVDWVVLNHGDEDSTLMIDHTEADSVWHDDSWVGEALMKQMGITQQFLDARSVTMQYVPRTQGISTTDIIERIRQRD